MQSDVHAGSTLNHWPFPWRHLHEGYAYLLTHPGTPCVFWDHWVHPELGDTINKLLQVRIDNSLSARSKVRGLVSFLPAVLVLGT